MSRPKTTSLVSSDFFSCDWGTTSFRLRRVDSVTGKVLEELKEPSGARALLATCPGADASARSQVYERFIQYRLQTMCASTPERQGTIAVVISGMASSSVGWLELPYAQTPFPLDGSSVRFALLEVPIRDQLVARIYLVSGVATATEMMRGEETEILGLYVLSDFVPVMQKGCVILPGTHSKHVWLRDGCIEKFHTYMTGELYEVLSTQSILRVSVEAPTVADLPNQLGDPQVRQAFTEGVRCAREPGLARSLFQVRARTVIQGVPAAINGWFLRGLLIGTEIDNLLATQRDVPLLLAAPHPISAAYEFAFEILDLSERVACVPADHMLRASIAAHRSLIQRWEPST